MSTDNGIKVSRGYALIGSGGHPTVDSATKEAHSGKDPVVLVWADDYAALEADAKRAREPKIKTPCPSCGNQSLFVPEHGLLTCSVIGCKAPAMLNDMAMERRKQMETTNETPRPTLVGEIKNAINRHNRESASNTPDFILADYMLRALEAFEHASREREKWYGRSLSIGGGETLPAPTPSLAERFPVGRTARVTRCDGWSGRTGQIESVAAEVWLRMPGGLVGFRADEIELLPEGPTPAPWVPKVGERIEILPGATEVGVPSKHIGETSTIDTIDSDGDCYFKLAGRHYCCRPTNTPLRIRPAPTPEPTGPEVMHETVDESGGIGAGLQSSMTAAEWKEQVERCQDYIRSVWSKLPKPFTPGARVDEQVEMTIAALREKLAAAVRERDEARAERDREAREFEREAFLRLFVGYSVHIKSLNNEAVMEWSTQGAAAARAAMFPGEVKA